MRTLALPKEVEHWSLSTLREKLVKIGGSDADREIGFPRAVVATEIRYPAICSGDAHDLQD